MSTPKEENYLNNPNLKPAGIRIDFTPEMISEYVKCSEDHEYFIEKYVKIINIDEGLVPFKLYDKQKDIARTICENRFSIIKTCRQAGKTTTTAATILWHLIFNENYLVAILANKQSTAIEILGRVQLAFESLPRWLQQGVVSWNKKSMELENGSRCIAESTASDSIRGYSINFLYLDEFAHVHHTVQSQFFTSVYPTIISGQKSKVVITSTPNGYELFYKIWTESVEKLNDFANCVMNWWDVPGRDEAWKEKTIANMIGGADQFRQEFEHEFLGSTNTLISADKLRELSFTKPLYTKYDGDLRIHEEPQPDHVYFGTVDTSRGVGLDSSAFTIIDVTEFPYRVVAAFDSEYISPLIFPEIIYESFRYYNNAYAMIEINDNGQQVADALYLELEYDNVISTINKGRSGQIISAGFGSKKSQRGVRTTIPVKRVGCANFKTLVERNQLIITDYDMINELVTFVVQSGSYAADKGRHDDLVMCLVLFSWATNQEFFKDITNTNFRKKLSEDRAEEVEEDDVLPAPIIDNHLDEDFFNDDGDRWVLVRDDSSDWW